jgi:hypothetical protein
MASATSVWGKLQASHLWSSPDMFKCGACHNLVWAEKSRALCYSAAFYRLAFGWFCGRHALELRGLFHPSMALEDTAVAELGLAEACSHKCAKEQKDCKLHKRFCLKCRQVL